jgi:hypothetical protein
MSQRSNNFSAPQLMVLLSEAFTGFRAGAGSPNMVS